MPEAPDLNHFLLDNETTEILKELDKTDRTSFRFRYPSTKIDKIDVLQEVGWKHDDNNLYPITGLPKESGHFFNHLSVINSMHKLVKNLQEIMNDYLNEYLAELESDFPDYY